MATIMEKDVLLEYVASEIAKASLNDRQEIADELAKIRKWLYISNYAYIDYQGVIKGIKRILQAEENA